MFMGRVVGNVWSSVKWKGLGGLRFVLVRPYHYQDLLKEKVEENEYTCYDCVVAADILGACPGEDVIVAYGHSARVGIEPQIEEGKLPYFPIDASVVAIVDKFYIKENEDNN